MKDISVFLGANSAEGFRSLYEEYIEGLAPGRLWILKGSAGCGKSGLMKRVADRAAEEGEAVIRVLCSGDPASLDGVCLPERGLALFDGTSPHVLEPELTGERGFYLDLSRFYIRPAEGLGHWEAACREHYRRAYRLLAAAGSAGAALPFPEESREAVTGRALAFARRNLPKGDGSGRVLRFFTDAVTCRGVLSLAETRRALAPRLISLRGDGARADLFLRTVLEEALRRGLSPVLCPDPLEPERIAHLLLPEAGLGLTSGEGDRRIRLDRLGPEPPEEERARRKEILRLRDALLSEALEELASAKEAHDALEEAAGPCIDFSGVTKEGDRILLEIFG
ncbi:MAG: hypothetical protein IKD79_05560 [Oscillospiraceae bacterium]|nr:hypothetical protein [Oscillospiraceae bacterium]